jgi:hypothetical protein
MGIMTSMHEPEKFAPSRSVYFTLVDRDLNTELLLLVH